MRYFMDPQTQLNCTGMATRMGAYRISRKRRRRETWHGRVGDGEATPRGKAHQLLRRERIRPRGVVSGGARRVALEARANNGGLRRRECGRQLGAQPVAVADIIRVLEHEEAAGATRGGWVTASVSGVTDVHTVTAPLRHYL